MCQTPYRTQDPFICNVTLKGSVFICAHMQVCVCCFVIGIEKLHLPLHITGGSQIYI